METVILYIVGILVVALGVLASIVLHELGHFLPAKAFGVRVSQFMVGFGRTLWSVERGGTEYGIKAIPAGGYIAMAGMVPPKHEGDRPHTASTGFFQGLVEDARTFAADEAEEIEERELFYRLPILKRIIIMLGGPAMNVVLAIVCFAIVLCGFGVPQLSTTIGAVNECVLPDTSERSACAPGDAEAPGAAAGLLPGDRLIEVAGTSIGTGAEGWMQATAIIQGSAGRAIPIVVERDGERVALTATPVLTERYVYGDDGKPLPGDDGTPLVQSVGMLGISAAQERVVQSPGAVLPTFWDNSVAVAGIIIRLPERMYQVAVAAFGPEERDPNGPIGLVGVGRIAGEINSLDTIPALDRAASLIGLIGSVNVALFVFNLIPLMPLDGGRIAVSLWEGARRRVAAWRGRPDPGPVDIAKLLPYTMGVIVVLAAMSIMLLYADIVKPVTLF